MRFKEIHCPRIQSSIKFPVFPGVSSNLKLRGDFRYAIYQFLGIALAIRRAAKQNKRACIFGGLLYIELDAEEAYFIDPLRGISDLKPVMFQSNLKGCPNYITSRMRECYQGPNPAEVIVITVNLDTPRYGSHANVILYNRKTESLEWFEPHGHAIFKSGFYGPASRAQEKYKRIKQVILETLQACLPVRTIEDNIGSHCPVVGLQVRQFKEMSKLADRDFGFCTAWTYFYAMLRIINPHVPAHELIQEAERIIKETLPGCKDPLTRFIIQLYNKTGLYVNKIREEFHTKRLRADHIVEYFIKHKVI